MKITLNLATRPFIDLGPILQQLRIGMGVLAALALLFALGLHLIHSSAEAARQRDHSLDGQIAQISQERQGYQTLMSQHDNALLIAESGTLNNLFEEKAFSWTLSLESLEKALPPGVHMITIEPNREKDGRIVVHLRVAGPRDREEELVRALERSDRFRSPRIAGENAEQSSGYNQQKLEPVSASNRFTFDILADYNPPDIGTHRAAAVDGKPEAGVLKTAAAPGAKPAPDVKVKTIKTAKDSKPHPAAKEAR